MKYQADFYHLSFSELSSDLHSVKVPSWVGAPVVVSYPDFLYNVTDVLELGKDKTVSTVLQPLPSGV